MSYRSNRVTPAPTGEAASGNIARTLKDQKPRIMRCGPLVVLALLLVACGSKTTDGGSDEPIADPTDTPAAESSAAPATEGTGPERPAPPGEARPAIDIASLPVGRDANDDETTARQCVTVSWLGSRIPDGISVVVTAVRITPSDAFTQSSSGCGHPLCRASFVFSDDDDTCSVPVVAKRSSGASAQLFMDGKVRCPAGREAACRDFAAKAGKKSIRLRFTPDDADPSGPTD
jgi:hypothetical protein